MSPINEFAEVDEMDPISQAAESETTISVIAIYTQIARITESMRIAASNDEWATVIDLGGRYFESVNELKAHDEVEPVDEKERLHRTNLLKIILSNDAQTREMISPEMSRISKLLKLGIHHQRCIAAYGVPFVRGVQAR